MDMMAKPEMAPSMAPAMKSKKKEKKEMGVESRARRSTAAVAEESKQSVQKPSAPKSSGPSLESVIASQSTEGYWPASTKASLAAFFKDGMVDDSDVFEIVANLGSADAEQIYATLLAIFLLTEAFSHKEDEWTLLVRKAKAYLKAAGLDKSDKVLRKFNLELKS